MEAGATQFPRIAIVRWCRACSLSSCHVAMALALPAADIAWPIFVVLVLDRWFGPWRCSSYQMRRDVPFARVPSGGARLILAAADPVRFRFHARIPADHRSTKLAQIFFAGLQSFVDSDLHVPVV